MEKKGLLQQRELFFICLAIILGLETLLAPMEKALGTSSWLAVVISMVLGLILAILYHHWGRQFAGKTFGEIMLHTYGVAFGKIILFLYVLCFLGLVLNHTWFLSYFWSSLGLTQTPQLVYLIGFMLFAVLLAYGGSTSLGKLANFLIFLAVILTLVNILLMLQDADFQNLQPLWQFHTPTLAWTAISSFLLLYGELFLIFPLLGDVKQPEKTGKTVFWAVLFGGICILLAIIRNIGILGESLRLYSFPMMQVLRLAEIGKSFSRIEVFGAFILVLVGAIRLGAGFLATTTTLKDLWQLPTVKPIVFPLAILVLALSKNLYQFTNDFLYLMYTLYPFLLCIFAIGLPLITLIIAAIKEKRQQKKMAKAGEANALSH